MFTTQQRPRLVLLAGCLFLVATLVPLISSALVMLNNPPWPLMPFLMQGGPSTIAAACFIAAPLALAAALSGARASKRIMLVRILFLAYAAFLLFSRVLRLMGEVPLWMGIALSGIALLMPLLLAIATVFTPVLRGWERYLVPAIFLAVAVTNLSSFVPMPAVITTDVTNYVIALAALLMALSGANSVRSKRVKIEAT